MNTHGAVAVNRVIPKVGPEHYKSYSWRQPLQTHFRRVPCAEFQCRDFRNGWVTLVDIATELGRRQFDYLSHDKTRQWHMEKTGTSLVSFTYPPGQHGFDGPKHEHYRPVGYDPVMLVHGGDWRGNPRGIPAQIMRPADWIDDFATHQDRLARARR
jgi:hypothetical protein